MKITSVDVIAMPQVERIRSVVARVNCDEGFYGLGETGIAIGPAAHSAIETIRSVAGLIIGMDPMDIDVIWEKMLHLTFWAQGGGAIILSAISAIDTALWDLKARALNMPLYKLLGGKHNAKIRVYASQLHMGWGVEHQTMTDSPEGLRDNALKAVDQGITAVKVNAVAFDGHGGRMHFSKTKGNLTSDILKMTEERIKAVRDAIGPDVGLMLENNGNTDANTALQVAKIAENYDVMFMEEPTAPMHLEAFKRINEHTNVPIAAGERTYLRSGFLPFFQNRLLSMAQPDIGNCGGISEAMKIASMAYCYDVGIQAHVCSSPISVAVGLQFEAAIPNFVIHEHHISNTLPGMKELCVYDYQPVDGYIDVPELPGIGQELSDYALKNAQIVTVK